MEHVRLVHVLAWRFAKLSNSAVNRKIFAADYVWCNEPCADSCNAVILRHAWLSPWNKHMTTGRINQISIVCLFVPSRRVRPAWETNTVELMIVCCIFCLWSNIRKSQFRIPIKAFYSCISVDLLFGWSFLEVRRQSSTDFDSTKLRAAQNGSAHRVFCRRSLLESALES